MVVITPSDAPEPEPEREPTWDEQVAAYRKDRKNALTATATVMTLPVRKAKAVFAAVAAAGN